MNTELYKRTAIPIAAAAAVIASSWWYLRHPRAKFHIEYPHPKVPLAIRILARLPSFLRRPLLIQAAAPKPPLDGVDLISEDYDPFEMKELVKDKVWRVRYRFAADPKLRDAIGSMFGIDLADKAILSDIVDPKIRENVEVHMDRDAELRAKNQGLSTREKQRNELEAGCHDSQDMLVARLSDGDGLLLFNPCRMREPVVDFLNELGQVRYIVSGSSVHTNQLPQAAAAFESAKIVCAQAAEDKCIGVGMRKADFVYTLHDDSPRGYAQLQKELEELGAKVFHVLGDSQTQTLVVIAHDHLFEVDLSSYGNGERWLHLDQDDWENPPPSLGFQQIFYHASMANATISGYLPDYRLMAMDPSSDTIKIALDEPDSHSCRVMAASLRELLKLDFSFVDNVHSRKQDSLAGSEFREFVEHAWNWLDGKSLLE